MKEAFNRMLVLRMLLHIQVKFKEGVLRGIIELLSISEMVLIHIPLGEKISRLSQLRLQQERYLTSHRPDLTTSIPA